MHLRLWCRRCKLFGDRNRSISGVILLVCHGDNVISGVCLTDSMCCECVRRFVVCDGSGNLVCVSADDEIAIYVDFSLVLHLTGSGFFPLDAGILVDDLDVGITEIKCIAVCHAVVSAVDRKRTDAVAGQDAVLASVVADEEITAFFLDFLRCIEEQIIPVELQNLCGRHMVFKIFSEQIDWRFEINAVVAEVDETYEFVMGKAGKQAVF